MYHSNFIKKTFSWDFINVIKIHRVGIIIFNNRISERINHTFYKRSFHDKSPSILYAHVFSESNVAGSSIFQTVHFLARNKNSLKHAQKQQKQLKKQGIFIALSKWTRIHWLTGPANCKKATRHHAHLSLRAKSRKTNYAKSRKWPITSIWANFWQFRDISKLQFFLKNRFHSNWRSYLALTSGQKPKNCLEPFLRKISKCLILG